MGFMGKSSRYLGVTLFKPTGKWRAQISVGGKTTSLGDHETEEEAARAFDRAAINRSGCAEATTNFSATEYAAEMDQLISMEASELVQMLRCRARKTGTATSNYRGVSLLRQTQKWHAQINLGGRQVHLGFWGTEEEAARAYDRAAINKGAREKSRILTNFDINDYRNEVGILAALEASEVLDVLAVEMKRNSMIPLLERGDAVKIGFLLSRPDLKPLSRDEVDALIGSSSRVVPKLTHLPRWALPPGSAGGTLLSPAGQSSATALNTARSVVADEEPTGPRNHRNSEPRSAPPSDWGPSPRDWGPSPRDWGPSPQDWGPSPRDWGPSPRDWGPSPRDSRPSPRTIGNSSTLELTKFCESGAEGGMTLESGVQQALAHSLVAAQTDATANSAVLAVAAYAGDSLLQALQASQNHHKRLKAAETEVKPEPDGVAVTAAAAAAAAASLQAEGQAQSSLLGAHSAHTEVSPVKRAPARRSRAQAAERPRAASTNRRTRRKPERAAT
eukprot:jgi/Ulvmu1/9821/UM056_0062.1